MNNTSSFPILGILGLIFITLKLTGHITWSWFAVLAPFWIVPVVFLVIVVIGVIIGVFARK